jgi:hypothetical protein
VSGCAVVQFDVGLPHRQVPFIAGLYCQVLAPEA